MSSNHKIRHTTLSDLDTIQAIYASARQRMAANGNPNQWKNNRPETQNIIEDINNCNSYVIIDSVSDEICGVFSALPGTDPTYEKIYEGSWLNDKPYITIHRIASDGRHHGILKAAVNFSLSKESNVRIDTHQDNIPMQSALNSLCFVKCGTIYLKNGEPRIAFQLNTD